MNPGPTVYYLSELGSVFEPHLCLLDQPVGTRRITGGACEHELQLQSG